MRTLFTVVPDEILDTEMVEPVNVENCISFRLILFVHLLYPPVLAVNK
jgi:hypothetical protein